MSHYEIPKMEITDRCDKDDHNYAMQRSHKTRSVEKARNTKFLGNCLNKNKNLFMSPEIFDRKFRMNWKELS